MGSRVIHLLLLLIPTVLMLPFGCGSTDDTPRKESIPYRACGAVPSSGPVTKPCSAEVTP